MQIRKDENFFVELKPLRKARKLRQMGFYTFDCETKDGLIGKQLFCWGLGYRSKGGRNQLTALQGNEDLDPLFKKLSEWRDNTHYKIIYVHNLTFDARFLINWMAENGMEYFPIISGSNFIALIIDELKVKFVDSVQFLKTSQEKAEIEWEVEQELRKIDCSDLFNVSFDNWSKADKKRVWEHNKNDVMALHTVMANFRRTLYDISRTDCLNSVSLAGMAMKSFRREMEGNILNPFVFRRKGKESNRITLDYDDIAERFVRQSYYGGRCEVFSRERLYDQQYVDKVSMFPAVMAGIKGENVKLTNDKKESRFYGFPEGNPFWAKNNHNDKKYLSEIIRGKRHDLALISVKVIPNKDEYYPVLPKRINQRVMFLNCEFTGIYTSVELQYAYKRGYRFRIIPVEIQSINKPGQWVRGACGLIFPSQANYFTNFVGKFFALKKKSKGGKRKASKILLNSAYGKFGEEFLKKSPLVHYYTNELDAMKYLEFHPEPKKVHMKKNPDSRLWIAIESVDNRKVKPYMNISIATFITAYARLELISMIHHLESKGIMTKYCDTDSITVKSGSVIDISKNLGAWDIEQEFEEVQFLAPKAYISIKKGKPYLKLKGVGKSKIKKITKEVLQLKEKGKIKKEEMMNEIEKRIREPIKMAERYMNFRESHRYGVILSSKTPCKHYSFENLKRDFNKGGFSKPWDMKSLPKIFFDGLNELDKIKIKKVRIKVE